MTVATVDSEGPSKNCDKVINNQESFFHCRVRLDSIRCVVPQCDESLQSKTRSMCCSDSEVDLFQ